MSKDLDKNIETLKSQNYHNFEVYFGDDMSTDNSAHLIEGLIRDDDRFHLIKHTQKHFSMKNIYRTIEYAKPNDDDIIVLVDGDDRLANENVLALLKKTYEEKKCLMTYGSFSYNGKISRYCKPYPKLVHKTKLYRFFSWRASHLKTFKYSLWKKIPLSSLTLTKKEINRTLFSFLITLRIRSYLNCRKVK
ncbi:glycosyltransferase family 2 protein, partial [Vibrio breoganii]